MRNSYDHTDQVRRIKVVRSGPLKIAAYRVRNPETGQFGTTQFHFTHGDTVMAVLSAASVNLLKQFSDDILMAEPPTDRERELLGRNNEMLEENRAQRRLIAKLMAPMIELTSNRSDDYLHPDDRQMLVDALKEEAK